MAITSAGVSNSPGTSTAKPPAVRSCRPAATKRLERPKNATSSSPARPYASTSSGATCTSTTSSRSPVMVASSTLGMASNVSCRSLARRNNVLSGTGPDSVTTKTGCSERLTSSTTGSSASAGSSALALSTAARTSVSAASASNPAVNSRTTFAPPW